MTNDDVRGMIPFTRLKTFSTIFSFLYLTGTSSTPNPMTNTALESTGKVYGFWNGLWDGMTAIFAFIGNLFGGQYGVYQVHNNGNWYDFGFLLGIGAFAGGASISAREQ